MQQVKISFLIFIVMSVFLGLVYPLTMTGITQLAFPIKAGGSLISIDGRVIGSGLVGQNFNSRKYFHGRPSANNYDGIKSGGSNYGPTNKKFIEQTRKLADLLRKENGLPPESKIPADLVLASGSGLDPHISLDSALLQAPRIAGERKINASLINELVKKNMEMQYFGIFGDSFVNVLKLNIALDSSDATIKKVH